MNNVPTYADYKARLENSKQHKRQLAGARHLRQEYTQFEDHVGHLLSHVRIIEGVELYLRADRPKISHHLHDFRHLPQLERVKRPGGA